MSCLHLFSHSASHYCKITQSYNIYIFFFISFINETTEDEFIKIRVQRFGTVGDADQLCTLSQRFGTIGDADHLAWNARGMCKGDQHLQRYQNVVTRRVLDLRLLVILVTLIGRPDETIGIMKMTVQ